MKFRTIGHAAWAGVVSVGLIAGMTACTQTNTIDYVFVAKLEEQSRADRGLPCRQQIRCSDRGRWVTLHDRQKPGVSRHIS